MAGSLCAIARSAICFGLVPNSGEDSTSRASAFPSTAVLNATSNFAGERTCTM
jgi:hypothetical protein